MNITQGWLSAGTRLESPNTDKRPNSADISLLVIHNISLPPEQFGGPYIGQLFSNCLDASQHPYFVDICNLKVSSHLLIEPGMQVSLSLRDAATAMIFPLVLRWRVATILPTPTSSTRYWPRSRRCYSRTIQQSPQSVLSVTAI